MKKKVHATLALAKFITKDESGKLHEADWNYCKIIGMLNHLAAVTRKDILFATHQCAYFLNRPMRLHQISIKWIV